MYYIFTSYGNDSIALIQWAHEQGLEDVWAVHSSTGWAASYWAGRVLKAENWVESLGFKARRTGSEGMENLVRRKKAWPRGGGGKYQFCTEALKKAPANEWMDRHDPEKQATVITAIRRCESKNRSTAPEWVTASENHGGRELWQPLVRWSDNMRDERIERTPFRVLPYKSKECWPCVNAGKKELRHLEPERIELIDLVEQEMGTNSKGNKRVMFSPARHNGAVGIRAVVEDAKKGDIDDLFPRRLCEGGWCE
jgi:3'-phosphoadenosine 5'-phosphosulfate sulfotransferase (PAPS reductase)/FAD synthetase